MKSVAHQRILSPVRQAVIHRDLLPFCYVSNRDDNQAHLRPTVDFADAAVGGRVEKHGSSDTAGPFLPELRNAGKRRGEFIKVVLLQLRIFNRDGLFLPELGGIR